MLDNHKILKLKTSKGEDIEIEVNYSSHKKVKDCQMLKIKFADKEMEVKRDDIMAVMMAIGRMEDVKKLLPMKATRIRKMERLLTFDWVASRDYKKGEKITVKAPWIDTMPETEEIFAGNILKKDKEPNSFKRHFTVGFKS